jgi:iron(III) transport system ATP-binding protein
MPAIEVENLVIRYGSATAVDRVSFAVNQGEQLTLLGPSGCGKTSTLRAVAGLERPDAGAIRIGGRIMYEDARRMNVPAEQRGLSMVFQSYAIWPHMTVFENVAYGLRVRGASGAALKEKVYRASGWRWHAPSRSRRRSCCSTNRCPTSTPSCAPRCASNCVSCSTG